MGNCAPYNSSVMVTIVFKDDQELSFDGLNSRKYEKGRAYTASHPQENIIFASFVAEGKAELYVEPKSPAEPKSTKVSKPKGKK